MRQICELVCRRNLRATVVLALALFSGQTAHTEPTPPQPSSFLVQTREANAPLLAWLKQKRATTADYLARRGTPEGPPHYIDYFLNPSSSTLDRPTAEEARIAAATKRLHDEYFPPADPSSYVGTFFESGHPYIETVHGPYQWNSQKSSGISHPAVFEAAVKKLTENGLKSIRIGPNLHEIDPENPATWNAFLGMIETIWKYEATPTVSVAFFPSLKGWQVKLANGDKGSDGTGVDYLKSYLLNPAWPKEMGELTEQMMRLLWQRAAQFESAHPGRKVRIAINPVNEPETLAGFNRDYWHGAHAPSGSPENMRFYIPSIIAIAKANVAIRLAAERASPGRRLLFMHNEAMTPDYYASHHGFGRFAVSKFMLGDRVIMTADLAALTREPLANLKARLGAAAARGTLNELDWSFREFVFGSWNNSDELRETARTDLVNQFKSLVAAHRELTAVTHKTMRTDNTLHLDYYYQTEYRLPDSAPDLARKLSANAGEMLKVAFGVTDDDVFIKVLREALLDLEHATPGLGDFAGDMKTRGETDFERLLAKEDFAALEFLMGVRSIHTFRTEPTYKEIQKRAGLKPVEFYRTDDLLLSLSADHGARLAVALGVPSTNDLRELVERAGHDTSDGGPSIDFAPNDSLRDRLGSRDRLVLRRLIGIKRDRVLGFEPQHYARQMRSGMRHGFSHFFTEYVNSLRIFTAGVGESGTPYYIFAPLLHDQVAMEYASLMNAGLFATRYDFGPAVSTRGWGNGPLSLHYIDDHELNPSGMFNVDLKTHQGKLVDFDVRYNGVEKERSYWLPNFLRPLLEAIRDYRP